MNIDLFSVATAAFIVDWALRIGFLLYIPRKRKPSSAIAWLLVIFLLPGIGILLFLVIGSPKLSKKRRFKQTYVDGLVEEATRDWKNERLLKDPVANQRVTLLSNLARSLGKFPVRDGNTIKILPEYNKAIKDIVSEVKSAKEFIHIEYFIIALDDTTQPLFDEMKKAVKRGVKVRVMFDGMGYRAYPRRREMKRLLTEIGVEWHIMLPPKIRPTEYNRFDLRNHRKIVVIDDRVAYIGSQNMIDRTYHRKDDIYYDELVAKMTGPIVRQCAVVFASDWYFETGEKLLDTTSPKYRKLPKPTGKTLAQIVPSGPSYEYSNNSKLFSSLFHAAQKKIVITNPYFVPDEPILDAITTAARRGVEVIIINSEAMDQWMVGHAERSYYQELMEAGIKIFLYDKPILLHSKHITIDEDIAVIGSSNMDIRSFELDLECVVVAYDKQVVKDLQKVQKYNLSRSTQVDLNSWAKRPFFDKFRDSIARLTSALQ